jgi:hypothetical protein
MALQINKKLDSGLEFSSYARVEGIKLTKDRIFFDVSHYADKDKDKVCLSYSECAYDISGSNPFAQAYVYLKGLSEFSEATDV